MLRILIWVGVSVLGAGAMAFSALHRGEEINALWLVVAGLCTFAVGLLLSVWGGSHLGAWGIEPWFDRSGEWLAWAIILYGFAASVLPVWLLLAPRDYLSTFMKTGTVALLALAVILSRPSCTCRS